MCATYQLKVPSDEQFMITKRRNILRENVIHVGAGFVANERLHVVETLSTLGPPSRQVGFA